jgi:hypothetical protein
MYPKKRKSKSRRKSSKTEKNKSSTLSFTIDLVVEKDRVQRIQSAFSMRKSREKPSYSQNTSQLVRDNVSQSAGLLFDDWCYKKETEMYLKHQILKKIKEEMNSEIILNKEDTKAAQKARRQKMTQWMARK